MKNFQIRTLQSALIFLTALAAVGCGNGAQDTMPSTGTVGGVPGMVNGIPVSSTSPTNAIQLSGTYDGWIYKFADDGTWSAQAMTMVVAFSNNNGQVTISSSGQAVGNVQINSPLTFRTQVYNGYLFSTNILTASPLYQGSLSLTVDFVLGSSGVDPAQSSINAYDCVNPAGPACSVSYNTVRFSLTGKR